MIISVEMDMEGVVMACLSTITELKQSMITSLHIHFNITFINNKMPLSHCYILQPFKNHHKVTCDAPPQNELQA